MYNILCTRVGIVNNVYVKLFTKKFRSLNHNIFQPLTMKEHCLYGTYPGSWIYGRETSYDRSTPGHLKEGYLEEHPDIHVIVTHAQFLNLTDHVKERYQLVVDEDILYTIMRSTGSMALQEIQNAYMDQVFPNAIRRE